MQGGRILKREKPPGADWSAETGIEVNMQIDFEKMDGLAPAIVQEDSTGEVLMVGFMNAEA
jgi:phosphoribosyl-ATP pyrophosphohydrolase/phosphoribosyl-AMP cyclohydrolase